MEGMKGGTLEKGRNETGGGELWKREGMRHKETFGKGRE